ncbi:type II secretion system F family protein [Pseudoduganella sp. GCM10020061]|uniref:type II secretion system F family protein n=1 Tax=Pseudoduganella sp. GCM10020061 TaxID=3317345 RepID=UPI00363F6912
MTVLPILVFVAVASLVGALAFILIPTRVGERLRNMSPAARATGPAWTTTVVSLVGPFANLSAPEGKWDQSPLRLRFLNAGLRRDDARLIYFGLKTLLPISFAFCTWLVLRGSPMSPMALLMNILLAALVGCYLPNFALSIKLRARKRELFENFPDAADLMLVCVEAGQGLDAALVRVTEELKMKSRALAEELHLTNLEMRAGASREQSLRHLALRTGLDEIATFATMLTQSDRFGTSIGESLRVFSDDLRHKRQILAEELAAKIPTKMLLPLVLFVFPSIIMIILGPAIIRIVRTVIPMIGQS